MQNRASLWLESFPPESHKFAGWWVVTHQNNQINPGEQEKQLLAGLWSFSLACQFLLPCGSWSHSCISFYFHLLLWEIQVKSKTQIPRHTGNHSLLFLYSHKISPLTSGINSFGKQSFTVLIAYGICNL